MGIYDEEYFSRKLGQSVLDYQRNKDKKAYMGDSLRIALEVFAEKYGQNKIAGILWENTPAFEHAVNLAAANFSCPIKCGHSALSFLQTLEVYFKKTDFHNPAHKALSKLTAMGLA